MIAICFFHQTTYASIINYADDTNKPTGGNIISHLLTESDNLFNRVRYMENKIVLNWEKTDTNLFKTTRSKVENMADIELWTR